MSYRNRQAGFTLVEILIVVVILGILAAVVIPQFTNASESAKASSLVSQLQTIRSQLQLYQIQHNGNYPALADLQADDDAWEPMVEPHSLDANGDPDYTATEPDFGPYLQQAPRNPFNNETSVVAAAAAGEGWVYDEETGSIHAVVTESQRDDHDLNDSDVIVPAG